MTLVDKASRRYLPYSLDFDTRAEMLSADYASHLNEEAKKIHEENSERTKEAILFEYGISQGQQKIRDFIDLGRLPFSIVGHHNIFHRQARSAFVSGNYYPALVSACALGERILNHLIIDLSGFYQEKASFRKICSKKSFNDWRVAISCLEDWGVLLQDAKKGFDRLRDIRNSAVHFREETYASVRNDALEAFSCLKKIIGTQFGTFGQQPWMIEGTRGHCFIRKSYEDHPFVKTYFIPRCPYVGYRFAIRFSHQSVGYFDVENYGPNALGDAEFAELFNRRVISDVVNPDLGQWKPFQEARVFVFDR